MKYKTYNILSFFLKSRIFYIVVFTFFILLGLDQFSVARKNGNSYKNTPPALNKTYLEHTKADSIIDYAYTLMGVPYKWAGKTPEGFDCSGFIYHVFSKYGVVLPAGSAVLYNLGTPVEEKNLVKGDLVFFTGTNVSLRKVGHVGIISSEPGEKLQFIHSSSGGGGRGVIVNDLDHPHYEARYMGAKRIDLM